MESLFSDVSAWHIWIIAGILLFILEMFTPAFFAGSVGIGCFAAGIVALAGLGLELQIFIFCVVVLLVFITIRPLVMRHLTNRNTEIRTNADRLIGSTAKVVETIDPRTDEGRVQVFGDNWKARTAGGEVVETGARVQILQIEGTTLIVKPTI